MLRTRFRTNSDFGVGIDMNTHTLWCIIDCSRFCCCFFFRGKKLACISRERNGSKSYNRIVFFFFFVQIKWKQKYLQNTRTKIAVQALQTMQIRKYDVKEATALVESTDSGMAPCDHNTNENCVVCLEDLLNGQVCYYFFYFVCSFPYLDLEV